MNKADANDLRKQGYWNPDYIYPATPYFIPNEYYWQEWPDYIDFTPKFIPPDNPPLRPNKMPYPRIQGKTLRRGTNAKFKTL